jgi:hypothetical protein
MQITHAPLSDLALAARHLAPIGASELCSFDLLFLQGQGASLVL